MKHFFIINPVAGKGKAVSIIKPQIEAYAKTRDLDYVIYVTSAKGEAIGYVKKMAAEAGGENVRFYACGGDGTLYEVVNGAVGFPNAQVGVIPLGSGNDFVRLFGTKEQFVNVQAQIEGTPVLLDIIRCGGQYAINQCSMGLDAEVCAKQAYFNKMPLLGGEASYYAALLYCFLRKMGSEFTITIDGSAPYTEKVFFAFAGNSRWYGGGFMAAPIAMPDDGLLDFVVVKKNMPRIKLLPLINKYKNGQHMDWDITKYTRGKKMHVQSEKPAAVNIDGETHYVHESTFEIIEKGITFVVPSTASYFAEVASGIISDKTPLPSNR
jgi:YegS/Rv2252/BmrU family lipid kinase